jgi:hypothetical protein
LQRLDLDSRRDEAPRSRGPSTRARHAGGEVEQIPAPSPSSDMHGAVEPERPITRRALDDRVVREIILDRRRDAGLGRDEAERRARILARRIRSPLALADDAATPPARRGFVHAAEAGVEQRQPAHALRVIAPPTTRRSGRPSSAR